MHYAGYIKLEFKHGELDDGWFFDGVVSCGMYTYVITKTPCYINISRVEYVTLIEYPYFTYLPWCNNCIPSHLLSQPHIIHYTTLHYSTLQMHQIPTSPAVSRE